MEDLGKTYDIYECVFRIVRGNDVGGSRVGSGLPGGKGLYVVG